MASMDEEVLCSKARVFGSTKSTIHECGFLHSWFALLLLILLAASPLVSALMIKMSVEDLTKEADVIVIGEIEEVESRVSLRSPMIFTYSTVCVEKYIKGGEGKETLTLITQGGSKWIFTVWVEDVPEFTKNETVLVFLKKAGREFSFAGLVQGKYIVENDVVRDISGEKVSLKDFLRRVEDAIPPQDKETPKAQANPEAPGFGVILAITSILARTIRRRNK